MVKPYLIMLPGWGMKNIVWNKLNNLLSKDFELIFIEWDDVLSLDGFKEKVIEVIIQKKLSSFSLLGWSLGSLVAQDIASDKIWNIKNLILIGCTSSFIQRKESGYSIGWNIRILERMKSRLYKSPQETLYNFYDSMFSNEEKNQNYNNEFLQTVKNNADNQSINSLSLGLDYLIEKNLRTKSSYITAPLLIIQGGNDTICSLDGAVYLKNIIPNSNIEVIKGVGHIPFFTNPDVCYNLISKFIAKNTY